ncbi:hypothetical protein L3X38_044125 [Prunus dulcis]|uniref:Uncharacterized protein n=1 Tax=Prunus dulcis TaxID=3755 RepID=A0AAD4YN55_PRUDU|nr:hypothetical protein L3X38_044125 [Prunus dulcis]
MTFRFMGFAWAENCNLVHSEAPKRALVEPKPNYITTSPKLCVFGTLGFILGVEGYSVILGGVLLLCNYDPPGNMVGLQRVHHLL